MLPEPDALGRYITVRPDLRYHVVMMGEHAGEPILFLHGFPEFWWSWRYQLRFFDPLGYRLIAPDLRGFNYSDKPVTGYEPPNMARDLIGLLDALDYEQVTLVGNDYGGFLAYALAILHPQRVRRLVVINTLHPARWVRRSNSGRFGTWAFTTLANAGHQLGNPLMRFANQVLGVGRLMFWLAYNRQNLPFSVRYAYSRAYARAADTATAYTPVSAHWMTQQPAQLAIPQPILVLWSTHDVTAPLWVTRNLKQSIPHAHLQIIEKAGHWVQQEQPEQVNQAVLKFLKAT